MSSADDVLEQISHARADHTVGPDAMRWYPEPPAAPDDTVHRGEVRPRPARPGPA